MANKQLVPSVIAYCGDLAKSVNAIKEAGADVSVSLALLNRATGLLAEMQNARITLSDIDKKGAAMARGKEQAFYYREKVVPAMEALRKPADELERIVDKEYWPFPTYADLIFEV